MVPIYILSLTAMIKSNLMNGHDAHIELTLDSKVGPKEVYAKLVIPCLKLTMSTAQNGGGT